MGDTSKRLLLLGLSAMALTVSSLSTASAQLLTGIGDPTRGQQLFTEKQCARCHGSEAGGTASAPSLRRTAELKQPIELAGTIWNHSPQMTAKARQMGVTRPVLTGGQTGDILAYLYSLSFRDEPGDPKRGLALLKEKQCLSCHTNGKPAPTDAPPLTDLAKFSSSVAMLDAMWKHAADMQDEMRAQRMRRVAFAAPDMSHIVAYLRTLNGTNKQPAVLSGDAREGSQLFQVKGCTRCHAIYGLGGRVGPDLATRSLPRTPGAIAGLLWNHGSRMRQLMARYNVPQPTFSRGELTNLVAYLYFLGFTDPSGDAVHGRALFESRGCARCHSTDGNVKGRIGPDLAHSQAVLSPLEAARLMWEHAPRMEARLKEYGLKWPQFQKTELIDLLAYLTSLPTGSAQ